MMKEYAFPQAEKCGDVAVAYGGMTLRDYFAGQALPSALTQAFSLQASIGKLSPVEWAAQISFRVADAMLAERERES